MKPTIQLWRRLHLQHPPLEIRRHLNAKFVGTKRVAIRHDIFSNNTERPVLDSATMSAVDTYSEWRENPSNIENEWRKPFLAPGDHTNFMRKFCTLRKVLGCSSWNIRQNYIPCITDIWWYMRLVYNSGTVPCQSDLTSHKYLPKSSRDVGSVVWLLKGKLARICQSISLRLQTLRDFLVMKLESKM